MRLPVIDGVAAAVVAGGGADRDAQRGRVGHRRVHSRTPLRGPRVLGLTPADRDRDRGRGGLRGLGDRVDEAAVAVRREVDHLRRPRCGRADDVDVERDLHVGSVRIRTRRVGPAVHAGRGDGRDVNAEPAEVGVEVAVGVAAAELDDRDGLARAGGPGRELVDAGHLVRRVGVALGSRISAAVSRGPEVRPGLGPGVQAQHREHHAVQRGRHEQRALPVAVGDRPLAFRCRTANLPQLSAEHAGQLPERARHLDPPAGREHRGDLQAQAGERPPDQVHVGRVGPVPLGQLVAGEDGGPLDDIGGNLGPPAQHQRQLGPLGGVQLAGRRDARKRRALAAGQLNKGFGFFRHGQLLVQVARRGPPVRR